MQSLLTQADHSLSLIMESQYTKRICNKKMNFCLFSKKQVSSQLYSCKERQYLITFTLFNYLTNKMKMNQEGCGHCLTPWQDTYWSKVQSQGHELKPKYHFTSFPQSFWTDSPQPPQRILFFFFFPAKFLTQEFEKGIQNEGRPNPHRLCPYQCSRLRKTHADNLDFLAQPPPNTWHSLVGARGGI